MKLRKLISSIELYSAPLVVLYLIGKSLARPKRL